MTTAPAYPYEALPAHLLAPGGDPDLLRHEILGVIRTRIDAHPRSMQKRIGPSEIGTPCARRIAYKLAGVTEHNHGDGWKATIGTAVHTWLEECFANDNRLGPDRDTRWLLETRLTCGRINDTDIDGNCDIYDRITTTAIDWKITSRAKVKEYRRNGPGEQYRVQAHAYGNGWITKGLPVDRVAVFFLPRDDVLRKDTVHMWTEPHAPDIAHAAFARAGQISTIMRALPLAAALPLIPTADAYCTYCPWYRAGSTDLTAGCPGDPSVTSKTTSALNGDPFPNLGL